MMLYHGSPFKLDKLEPHQAASKVPVPEGELLNGIYLTPDYGFAVACAIRPEGRTEIRGKTIAFEHPELFNPHKDIYIYHIDSDNIPEGKLIKEDEDQFVAIDIDFLVPDGVDELKAAEVEKYYELSDGEAEEEIDEKNREINFKVR